MKKTNYEITTFFTPEQIRDELSVITRKQYKLGDGFISFSTATCPTPMHRPGPLPTM